MVWLAVVTVKCWVTEGAAAKLVLPACEAWIEHVPGLTSVRVVPDTVQTDKVVDVKVTARPEDAVALSVKGAVPYAWLERAPNVMVWLPCVTGKLWFTGVAAA